MSTFPSIAAQNERLKKVVDDFPFEISKENTPQNGTSKPEKAATKSKKRRSDKAAKAYHMILSHNTGDENMLFSDHNGTEYVAYPRNGAVQTMKIRSQAFREAVQHEFYERYKSVLGSQTLTDVVTTLAGQATALGNIKPVWKRVAEHTNTDGEKEVWIDLTNKEHEAIRITKNEWYITHQLKPHFLRSKQDLPLARPCELTESPKAALERLRRYINCTDTDFLLYVAFLVGAWNPSGSYPMLQFFAGHGAGKSSATRFTKRILDNQKTLVRSLSRDSEALFIAVQGAWLLTFDNASGALPEQISDDLCTISTGGGIARRTKFTDSEETVLDAKRPMCLNGLDAHTVNRPDLQDRTIRLELLPISASQRITERELETAFAEDLPAIIAGLCYGVQAALKGASAWEERLKSRLPRMADFTVWACAGLNGLGFDAEEFLKHYETSKLSLLQDAAEGDVATEALLQYMTARKANSGAISYTATARQLHQDLTFFIEKEGTRVPKSFPDTPNKLTSRLNRFAPALKAKGLLVEQKRTSNARNYIISWQSDTAPALDLTDSASPF